MFVRSAIGVLVKFIMCAVPWTAIFYSVHIQFVPFDEFALALRLLVFFSLSRFVGIIIHLDYDDTEYTQLMVYSLYSQNELTAR